MSTQETPPRESAPASQRGRGMLEADLGAYRVQPGRGRRGRRLVAGVLAVAVLSGAGWWTAGHPRRDPGPSAPPPAAAAPAPAVQRQGLSGRTKVNGTLGYAGSASVQSPLSGRITW